MKKKNFYYYGIIFYCFMLMFLIFAIIKSLHSLFLVPVTESLGMKRSEFSLIFSITGLSVAIAFRLSANCCSAIRQNMLFPAAY